MTQPAQEQSHQPGHQSPMNPEPATRPREAGSGRLSGKAAIITGGDSGIGRAVALAFAREGADIAVTYLDEDDDARETERLVREEGGDCLLVRGDVGDEQHCRDVVGNVIERFGRLDVLVNNAAVQFPKKDILEIDEAQIERTFRTNIFAHFFMAKAAVPYLKAGGSIINTASITAYRGSGHLLDYSATKGAIVSFTRSLSENLVGKGIRVNAVAPGPIWTPLIPATFSKEQVAEFGKDTPMGRPGQPNEVAPCYVFLASTDASYMSGQVLHPNGGQPAES